MRLVRFTFLCKADPSRWLLNEDGSFAKESRQVPWDFYFSDTPHRTRSPLHYQALWLKTARHTSVSEEVIDGFVRLRDIAYKNHAPYRGVLHIALGNLEPENYDPYPYICKDRFYPPRLKHPKDQQDFVSSLLAQLTLGLNYLVDPRRHTQWKPLLGGLIYLQLASIGFKAHFHDLYAFANQEVLEFSYELSRKMDYVGDHLHPEGRTWLESFLNASESEQQQDIEALKHLLLAWRRRGLVLTYHHWNSHALHRAFVAATLPPLVNDQEHQYS